METLVINRGELLTGTPLAANGGTGTLREPKSGLKCCLGVYGSALGFSDTMLTNVGILSSLSSAAFSRETILYPSWLHKRLDAADQKRFAVNDGTTAEDLLAKVNDTPESKRHPKRRESAIAYVFKKYGDIEVVFEGSYADGTARWRKTVAA